MKIEEIIANERPAEQIIADLKKKTINVPGWETLEKEYDTSKHPVMNKALYPDKLMKNGTYERVTRYTLGWQKLAVKRMTELLFGLPVTRVYSTHDNEDEKRVSLIMEDIFKRNRINSVNIERGRCLYASCEVVTLWYSQEVATMYAGEQSPYKLRCKNYSPMNGDTLYPLFDEYDDMIALSVEYSRTEGDATVTYFDTYTADKHIRWRTLGNTTEVDIEENIDLQKIAGVYAPRPEPIWESQSANVYEAEWTLSRNGNYIRKNARPNWVVFSDEDISFGGEKPGSEEGRNVMQYSANSRAEYVTWQQAIDSIKFHIEEIKRNFFMELQLPDMSMDNMKATPMSGEARKMMFIDAQMKATDESGLWYEYFDREINVIRAFMKKMYPQLATAIDNIQVDVVITPYQIRDEAEKITNLTNATGGKAVMSQRTAIANLGYVEDVDAELEQIANEDMSNVFEQPAL